MEVSVNHSKAKEYIDNLEKLSMADMKEAMTYKWFRLNALYKIKDKSGQKVRFTPNPVQESFYLDYHNRDLVLKARQLGFTTFEMISGLDDCLFNENFAAGCICHTLDDAKDIFRNKIKFAYNEITDEQRSLIAELGYTLPTPETDKDNSYVFSNGSSIKVSTGYRGGTLQALHVSEFGKICKKTPDKAKEIVTGAFEAVPMDGRITLESTAEGREGYFYQYAETARKAKQLNHKPTSLEFNFHFSAWHEDPSYTLDGEIPEYLNQYFEELQHKHDIKLTGGQKAWYSAKSKILGDEMKREYPSTPKEAFEQSVSGAYYANQFLDIYKDGRITDLIKYKNESPVHTVCDIGIGDANAIWFYQLIGEEIHILHYYENSGEPLGHYIKYTQDKCAEMGWEAGYHYAPHDMNNREYASEGLTRKELAEQGVKYNDKIYYANYEIVPKLGVDDGIQAVRDILPKCVFDEKGCEEGIKMLEGYRKEWNDKLGCWRDRPLHDYTSHGSDAFRYLAVQETKKEFIMPSVRMR